MSARVIQLPTAAKRQPHNSAPTSLNLIDTAIVALEAIERPSGQVCLALVTLRLHRDEVAGQ